MAVPAELHEPLLGARPALNPRGYAGCTYQQNLRKLVYDMRAIPHIEATDSDVLRDTIHHHDVLIGEVMETAADRYQQRRSAGSSPLELDPIELDDLVYRFLLVLTVACELAARPSATGD